MNFCFTKAVPIAVSSYNHGSLQYPAIKSPIVIIPTADVKVMSQMMRYSLRDLICRKGRLSIWSPITRRSLRSSDSDLI